MSDIKFTNEQKSVIDARDCNLLVSAAAGSGKTAVLVERILSRLTENGQPASLDRMLVMTFTRAAAEGMRRKISEALGLRIRAAEAELEAAGPGSSGYSALADRLTWLKSQEALLPRARISTIDSVCQTMIRQYFQYLEIDPSFRVADEAELKLMKFDLLKDLLEEEYEKGDENFLRFSMAFTKNGLDERLSVLILNAFEFAQAKPWPEKYLSRCAADCRKELSGKIWETEWFGKLLGSVREKTEEQQRRLCRLEEMCLAPGGWKPYLEPAAELRKVFRALEAALSAEDPEEVYCGVQEVLLGYKKPVLPRKGCKEAVPGAKEEARGLLEELRCWPEKHLSGFFSLPAGQCEQAAAGSAADLLVLIRLTAEFMHRFTEKKRSRSVVDFGDMEHLALQLLYKDTADGEDRAAAAEEDRADTGGTVRYASDGTMEFTPLADELARGLDEILIDEYQDSNEVQEALIRALSAERFGRPDVFMVGDVKQSIYSFRQAKPELFLEKYRTFRGIGGGGKDILIGLNRNFRSRPEVLDTVNDVFREVMKPSCGGILYDDAAALYAGRPDCISPETGELIRSPENRTELLLVEEHEPDGVETAAGAETAEDGGEASGRESTAGTGSQLRFSDDELEFVMIAGRIRRLLEPEEGRRPWRKKDITILMRTSKKAEKLVDVLERFGIDACFDSATGYFASAEIRVMLSLLGIIDNPRQDIALAAVLKSPMAAFTDEELARIRIAGGKKENGKKTEFYDALRAAAAQEGETARKAAAFLTRLEAYRRLAGRIPVHELIYRIYRETGYYDYVSALPGGLKRRRNLDMLLEKAENYSATSYHGLFNFLRYIDQLKNYETDYGEAGGVTDSGDVIRITTIHRSKGLEYPVTVIAGLSGRFNLSDSGDALVMDEELGFACDYIDTEKRIRYPSMKAAVIRDRARTEQIGEELRVLYVAMTRAQDKLIMTGRVSNFSGKQEEEKRKAEDIAGCCSAQQILFRSGITEKESLLVSVTEKAALRSVRPDTVRKKEKQSLKAFLESSAVPEETLMRRRGELTAVYPYEEETGLKPKVSVSELKARVITESEFEFVRDLEENRETKGAEYGTMIHRAFELLDYGKEGEEAVPDLPGADEETMRSVRKVIGYFRKTELAADMKQAFLEGNLYRERHFMLGLPAAELTPGAKSGELQLMQGIIDAYILSPEGIRLIDYKTDRVENEEKLISRYALQLKLYARALEQLLRRPVTEMLIYSTCLGRTIRV